MQFYKVSFFLRIFTFFIGIALSTSAYNTAVAGERIRGDDPAPRFAKEPIRPIPLTTNQDPRIAALGQKLFIDPRLSRDDTVSCATCHPLNKAGVDGLVFSIGVDGAIGNINAPTVFNSGMLFVQFWDGRAASLEEQVDGPIHNPIEMASNWDQVIAKLQKDDAYKQTFKDLYPQGIAPSSIRNAIATFERTLITPNARFDKFLRGDENAITQEEQQGYILFKSYGCSSCHQGVAVGGNLYEKMGIVGNYFEDRGNITKADLGRFNITGIEEHRFEFKVPSLRNVALTAPYFHDGSADTLQHAVNIMAQYQLGRSIPPGDINKIIAFLKTLTGEFRP